jgi:Helix-turn-helix.
VGHKRHTPQLLPAKLLEIRKHLNKTQSQMLSLLNIDEIRARISEYENGTGQPSLITLLRYSKVSGVLINDLADDEVAVTELTFRKPKRRKRQRHTPGFVKPHE